MKHQNRLQAVLFENDRRGEIAIAVSQAMVAVIVFGFHIVSAYRNHWTTFSPVTLAIASAILLACMLRLYLARIGNPKSLQLNLLTILDGLLIFILIGSYSWAYDLSLATSFKAPSLIFLALYTGVRVLKLDPVPVLVAGFTVLSGWFGLLVFLVARGAETTSSYIEYAQSDKILIGANVEVGVGYLALIAVLALATGHARRVLENSADREELLLAKRHAEFSNVRQTALLQTSIDAVLIADEFGMIERCNPALENMFGYEAGELDGQSAAVLMSQENALLLATDIAAYSSGEDSRLVGKPFESEGIKSDGKKIPIELSISGIEVDGNRYFAGFIRDISSRKEAQRNEQMAIANLADVVTSALDAIVVIDQRGLVVEFNPAAEEIFGFSADEIIGQEMAKYIVPQKHRKAHRDGMVHYLKTGEGPVLNQRIEIDAIRSDGSEIIIELAIRERVGEEGSLFFGYMRDVTEKKASEVALVEAKEKAEIANQAKASFLAMMSHEIRTPLNGVLGVLTLLSDKIKEPQQAQLVGAARTSGRALLTLINDILDFSKLEAGKIDLAFEPFDTKALIDSVTDIVGPQVREKNIGLNIQMDAAVPPALMGDEDRIRQIVLNLVSNAVKFTEEGTIELTVENTGSAKKPVVKIAVSDTGIGIARDQLQEVFAEFSTINTTYNRQQGGTGLGLSICKMLCEAMKGNIGVESEESLGSTFWFELPLEVADPASIDDGESQHNARALLEGLGEINVLLAEDNSTNQLVIRHMLEGLGCHVEIANDGVEAVTHVKTHTYDLVLMDISMPNLNGIEATKKIRQLSEERAGIPIVALTAYALDADKDHALASGMDDFVSKPVSRMGLAKAIAAQLSSVELRTEQNAPDHSSTTDSILNKEILDDLMNGMPTELRRRIMDEFVNDITRHQAALASAHQDGDVEGYERATHGLKGVSATFGAGQLETLSKNANEQVRAGQTEEAFALIDPINAAAADALTAIEGWVGNQFTEEKDL